MTCELLYQSHARKIFVAEVNQNLSARKDEEQKSRKLDGLASFVVRPLDPSAFCRSPPLPIAWVNGSQLFLHSRIYNGSREIIAGACIHGLF
jgi:hypothetical protein